MDSKVTSILSYFGVLWLVAYFAGNYNRITKQFGVIKYFAAPGTVGAVYR